MKQIHIMAIAATLAAVLSPVAVFAEKADAKASGIKGKSSIEISTSMGFKDADDSASVLDWTVDSKGPEVEFTSQSGFDFQTPFGEWLRMGPSFYARGDLELLTVTPTSGNPYLVGEDYNLLGLVGWDIKGSWKTDALKVTAILTPLGGVDVLDLTDADTDYLYTGADPADFWFRVLPALGFGVGATGKVSFLEAELYNRYLTTWDSGTAYGRSWPLGFDERFKGSLAATVADGDEFGAQVKFLFDYSLKSNLIEPKQKIAALLRADLGWKDSGKLKLTALQWTDEADIPGMKASATENIERQLSSGIAWEASGRADWTVGFVFPWFATLDGESSSGVWTLYYSCKLGG
jgi:hypothetical protein